jgi:hypothetical protein
VRVINDVDVYNGLKVVLELDDGTLVEEPVAVATALYVFKEDVVAA